MSKRSLQAIPLQSFRVEHRPAWPSRALPQAWLWSPPRCPCHPAQSARSCRPSHRACSAGYSACYHRFSETRDSSIASNGLMMVSQAPCFAFRALQYLCMHMNHLCLLFVMLFCLPQLHRWSVWLAVLCTVRRLQLHTLPAGASAPDGRRFQQRGSRLCHRTGHWLEWRASDGRSVLRRHRAHQLLRGLRIYGPTCRGQHHDREDREGSSRAAERGALLLSGSRDTTA